MNHTVQGSYQRVVKVRLRREVTISKQQYGYSVCFWCVNGKAQRTSEGALLCLIAVPNGSQGSAAPSAEAGPGSEYRACQRTLRHTSGLLELIWQCSFCSSWHKGADTGPAGGLRTFYCTVHPGLQEQLPSPGICSVLLRLMLIYSKMRNYCVGQGNITVFGTIGGGFESQPLHVPSKGPQPRCPPFYPSLP